MSGEANGSTEEHPWALIGRRLSKPCKQWTFYAVLVVGILILGYLAVWIEAKNVFFFAPTPERAVPDLQPLRLAYATAILAVACPGLMQLLLSLNKMAVVTSIILGFVSIFLAYKLSFISESFADTNLLGGLGLIIATLVWWLANGEDELFQDRVNPGAPSGGDPNRRLPGGSRRVKT